MSLPRSLTDASTRPVVLLGDPVAHSLSPLIHNTAFAADDLPLLYTALRVPPADLARAVDGLRAVRFAGGNVTIPHKERVVEHVDRLTPAAAAIGAVNTLYWDGDVLMGDNTDAAGFAAPLRGAFDAPEARAAIVLGAGGAARAAAYALLALGLRRLYLVARTAERARALAAHLAPHDTGQALRVLPLERAADAAAEATLLVNATPVGMTPHGDATPWPTPDALGPEHLVYDLVYAPRRTRLLREAHARGARTLGGLEMLVGQAAAAYAHWTGRTMPLDDVWAALEARIGDR